MSTFKVLVIPPDRWQLSVNGLVIDATGVSCAKNGIRCTLSASTQAGQLLFRDAINLTSGHNRKRFLADLGKVDPANALDDNGLLAIEEAIRKTHSQNGRKPQGGAPNTAASAPGSSTAQANAPTAPGGVQIDLVKDLAHAEVLSVLFKDRYRWGHRLGGWLKWNGKIWRLVTESVVAKAAADALRQHYATKMAGTKDKHALADLARRALETCIHTRIVEALKFLRGYPDFHTEPDAWDRDAWLLNVQNGTLDLRTGVLQPHNPKNLLTRVANAAYNPSASRPMWEAHLRLFLPDDQIRRQVQRDLGLALAGGSLDELLPIWYGEGGNGKSTSLKTIMTVLGDYAQMAAPKLLAYSKYDRHPTELAELRARRLIFEAEINEGVRLDEARIKMLTGGEPIRAHFMRENNIEFPRTWIIVLVTNHKPEIRGSDHAIWRRIRLIPWTVKIDAVPGTKRRAQDEVVAELLLENDGILSWLVEGFQDWQVDHQWIAPSVQVVTKNYRAEQDTVGNFLEACCELDPRFTVASKDLYDEYQTWCASTGEHVLTTTMFSKRLKERGLYTARGTTGAKLAEWHGIRLKP
jgi:putative DNA primase/helicase